MSRVGSTVDSILNPVEEPEEMIKEEFSPEEKSVKYIKIPYSVISDENNASVNNYNILIVNKDYSESQLQTLAFRVKEEMCDGNCNINIFDSRQAYGFNKRMDIEEERLSDQLMNQQIDIDGYNSQKERIERKYYVHVADHFVGWLEFSTGTFTYYPFQDTRYQELGGTNYKK
jgi:hypothetical protein